MVDVIESLRQHWPHQPDDDGALPQCGRRATPCPQRPTWPLRADSTLITMSEWWSIRRGSHARALPLSAARCASTDAYPLGSRSR